MNANARPRLLVIDDDKKLCRLIADYLTPMGYEVSMAHTGPEGASQAAGSAWVAVILDGMLPGMDGFEVLKRIRKTSDVPVLIAHRARRRGRPDCGAGDWRGRLSAENFFNA